MNTTDDLIKREEAIDAICDCVCGDAVKKDCGGMGCVYNKALMELPSAQSEPKPGHWIKKKDRHSYVYGECSNCGISIYAGRTKFCPNCGAKMENACVTTKY